LNLNIAVFIMFGLLKIAGLYADMQRATYHLRLEAAAVGVERNL
jgi:hypothetical protein